MLNTYVSQSNMEGVDGNSTFPDVYPVMTSGESTMEPTSSIFRCTYQSFSNKVRLLPGRHFRILLVSLLAQFFNSL